jgi:hypothetical protein
MRKYTVICHWRGKSELEADADEVVVYADSLASAAEKAAQKWRREIGSQWPHLTLTETSIAAARSSRKVFL